MREEYERAQGELLSCLESDIAVMHDFMSVITYLHSIDHWALHGSFDAIPWIGKLIHSDQRKSQRLGCFASSIPSLNQSDTGQDASLLMINTISKMLDANCAEVVSMALHMAAEHLSLSALPLLSPGIIRSLRSKHVAVRKRAWYAASKLAELDSGQCEEMLSAIWEHGPSAEENKDVASSMCSFFLAAQWDAPYIGEWADSVQRQLLCEPELHLVLQCKLLRLFPAELGLCQKIVTKEYALSAGEGTARDALYLEVYRCISRMEGLDVSQLHEFLALPQGYLKEHGANFIGLCLLECLVKAVPQTVLSYQEHILHSLEDSDAQIRLLALNILLRAANEHNWQVLAERCLAVAKSTDSTEDYIAEGCFKHAIGLIRAFAAKPQVWHEIMHLLDQAGELLDEAHLESVVGFIGPADPGWSAEFVSRAYLADKEHSVLHDLVVISFLKDRALFDPAVASNLTMVLLQKHQPDAYIETLALMALAGIAQGNPTVSLDKHQDALKQLERSSSQTVRYLARHLLHPGSVEGPLASYDEVASLASAHEPTFEEELQLFEHQRQQLPASSIARATPSNASSPGAVPLRPALQEVVDPAPFPAVSEQFNTTLEITSDLFKGLI